MHDDEPAFVEPAALAAPAAAPEPEPPTPEVAAGRAIAFEQRMTQLPADIDPSWQREFATRSPALALLPEGDERRHPAFEALLRRFCGPAPSIDRLAAEPAQIALQSRPAVLRALCLLALARRPGVLRCAVDRTQKELLQNDLGEALGAVEALAPEGRPVPHEATAWTPLHWSCLGYLDWLRLVKPDDSFLRRLLRLMLPRGLLEMPQRARLARPDFAARDAVARLGANGVRWPC